LLRRAEIPISSELVTFSRREQMERLKKVFGGKIRQPKDASGVTLGSQQ
jgi:hypothetical protein